MKNKLLLFVAVFFVGGCHILDAEAVFVVIPKQYLIEKASLVLYMLDELGNQRVGSCQLNEAFEQRNILQEELQIQEPDTLSTLSDSIEIINSSCPRDNEVVLHIEFDNDVRVVRILIVKDNSLANNSFGVMSISVGDSEEIDDFDALTDMIDGIDSSVMRSTSCVEKNSFLNQYALYVKIYCMMQYKHARRKMENWTTWLCKK